MLPEFDCVKCTAKQKLQRGCEKKAIQPLMLDGQELERCPRRPIYEEPEYWLEMLQLWQDFTDGLLPEDGGTLSQPAYMMQAFRIFIRAQRDADKLLEDKKKVNQGQGQVPTRSLTVPGGRKGKQAAKALGIRR